jgi:hypothetical protein
MKALLIAIILLSPAPVLAQARFLNLSANNPDVKELYVGVGNYLSIVKGNFFAQKQRFSVSHGEATRVRPGEYSIRVTTENQDTLKYYEDGKLVLSEVFIVKKVPSGIARLGNYPDTSLSVGQILANPFFAVIMPGSNYKHNSQILSFSSSFIDTNSDTTAILHQRGYLLSNDQLKEIRRLKPGAKIYLDNIRISCSSGRNTTHPPVTVRIK